MSAYKRSPHIATWLAAIGLLTTLAPVIAYAEDVQPADPLAGYTVRSASDSLSIVRGDAPRRQGIWHQYQFLKTPLRANLIVSDVLNPSDRWYDAFGQEQRRFDIAAQTPQNYHSSHNHYQNLLSEVINYTPGANGVAIWGDSAAVVDGASAWGGFVSARSSCTKEDRFDAFNKDNIDRRCGPDFDAQLTGLEVDVLNDGKPGVFPNKAKHGVQVVGFGHPNGQAFSVIVENFDREPQYQKGHFESVLYVQNALHPDYGRLLVADFPAASIGLDFRKPIFRNGAISFRSDGIGSGMLLNNGKSGEIYGGSQWPGLKNNLDWLTLRAGDGGLRVVSQDNRTELMRVDNFGGIYLEGDVFVGGNKVFDRSGATTLPGRKTDYLIYAIALLSLLGNVFLHLRLERVRRNR